MKAKAGFWGRGGWALGGVWVKIRKRGAHLFPWKFSSFEILKPRYWGFKGIDRQGGGYYFTLGMLYVKIGLNSL